jgi:hypothetical protein
MDFAFRFGAELGFARLVLEAIFLSLVGIVVLIGFIVLRRWYRSRYFCRLDSAILEDILLDRPIAATVIGGKLRVCFCTALFEHFPYRQMTLIWRLQGIWQYLRGDLTWREMTRTGVSSAAS